ncbi:MAG: T9SS type A sorting domain-containing protein [Ignavibacteriales bacterium]|nr:MAG: T9SS type A sorting domain-containing protein [Ignavibacteriales bacterium]
MSNVISYVVTIPPFPPVAVPILSFNDSVWIAPSNWIVKEFAPSTVIDLSVLNFSVFTIPGYTAEILTPPTDVSELLPDEIDFKLEQNYPNPFNPKTKIKYTVADHSDIKLSVYDVLGNLVQILVNENKSPGTYETEFPLQNGKDELNLTSGIYFYRLEINSGSSAGGINSITKKMIFIK